MDKRVVVTGLGVISSIGIGKDKFWANLIKGVSGISEVTSFNTEKFSVHRGGEVKDFNPDEFISKNEFPFAGRATRLAMAAARLTLKDACASDDYLSGQKTAVCMGTTMGESQTIEVLNRAWIEEGFSAIDKNLAQPAVCNMLVAGVASELNLKGPTIIIPNACAAGNFAIGYGYDLIRNGEADSVLAGGADAFSRMAFMGFARMFAVAPEKCQPFDKNRKGMMVAEGAAILLLESLDSALKRNAHIYAEVIGYGLSCDARHMTAPFSEGIKEAVQAAISESNIRPEDVDYISAHGTGTGANDKEECLGIKKVFPDYKNIPMSSIKSMLGHSMGAASAIEAVTCCLVIENAILPPTINYETPDPDCDIDCVPNQARPHKVNIALNNASAFGGNNSCLVLKKYPV